MFDRFVSGARPSWRRRAVLIASLSLHAAVALALVVAGFFHVAELTPPLLAVVFTSAPEPPPPPPPPAGHRKSTPRVSTPSPRNLPTAAPVTAPTPPEPVDPGGDHRVPGGDGPPDGKPGGVPNSHGDTPCVGAGCVAAAAPRPRNVPPHLLDAQKLIGADPHLPEFVRAQRHGLGDINFVARLCVDQRGGVSQVGVLSGIPGADSAIVETLRGWRYKPQPIPVCFVAQFVFSVP